MTIIRSVFNVYVERPETEIREAMNMIRSWLDSHKIEPVEFKTTPTARASVVFDIRFQSEAEASLFARDFQPAPADTPNTP